MEPKVRNAWEFLCLWANIVTDIQITKSDVPSVTLVSKGDQSIAFIPRAARSVGRVIVPKTKKY